MEMYIDVLLKMLEIVGRRHRSCLENTDRFALALDFRVVSPIALGL